MFNLQSRPALLIVDMQNGFCHENGTFGNQSPPLTRLRSICNAHNIPIFFSCLGYSADYFDSGISLANPPASAVKDVEGFIRRICDAEILERMKPEAHKVVFDKTRNSALRGTDLEKMLAEKGVNHLILVGVGTNVCVESTARDSFQSDFFTTTVSDATATDNEEGHEAAMKTLMWFGGTATVAEVEAALEVSS